MRSASLSAMLSSSTLEGRCPYLSGSRMKDMFLELARYFEKFRRSEQCSGVQAACQPEHEGVYQVELFFDAQ